MSAVNINPISVSLPNFLAENSYSKIMVLVDTHTKKYCYPLVSGFLPAHKVITIKTGENHKNIETCQYIWNEMTLNALDRHALLINIGGGVIGDMGGFCAATYKRGIDFIQIPTTLLSQVDASVGGKLGIDFNGLKNHIGSFQLPKTVLIDDEFLKTLPEKEIRSGFAEIIKHCLIRDKSKWEIIRKLDLENQDFNDLIRHSVEIKKKIVADDPTEKGVRKILNFGHTIGHAIETFNLEKSRILHGEAVAAGMIAEAFIAFDKKMISLAELIEIEEFIFSVYGNVKIDTTDFDAIINLMLQDKKNKDNQIRASILNGIGDCDYDVLITKKDIKKALSYYTGQ